MGILDVPLHALTGLTSALPVGSNETVVDMLPVLLAILVAILAATVVAHWRHALFSTPIPASVPLLPGGLPLLGHCIPALRNLHRLHDWLYETTQQMGEGRTFGFSLPLLPSSLMVTDPVCLEYVLKRRTDNFIKGPRFFLVSSSSSSSTAEGAAGCSSHCPHSPAPQTESKHV